MGAETEVDTGAEKQAEIQAETQEGTKGRKKIVILVLWDIVTFGLSVTFIVPGLSLCRVRISKVFNVSDISYFSDNHITT